MSASYEEYLKGLGIDKNKPVKIQFSETARAFYCPTCNTGTYNKEHKCDYCGQLLLGCYGFEEEKANWL